MRREKISEPGSPEDNYSIKALAIL